MSNPGYLPAPSPLPDAPDSTPHLPLARRLARRYRSPDHSPEDLAQEAALALLEGLRHHGEDPARLTVHVRSHLSRLYRSACRRQAHQVPLARLLDVQNTSVHAARADAALDLAEVLDHARSRLSGRQVSILERTAAGESDAEIGRALGLHPGRVRRDRSRAVVTLREDFADG